MGLKKAECQCYNQVMKRILYKAIGIANLGVSLFFILVSIKAIQDILSGSASHSPEGKILGLVFVLAVVIITGYAAWKTLYKDARKRKQQSQDEKLHQIMELARQRKGHLSALEAAMDTGLEIEESKALLELLVDKGLALMDINEHAAIIFNFPDFAATELLPVKHIPKISVEQERDF